MIFICRKKILVFHVASIGENIELCNQKDSCCLQLHAKFQSETKLQKEMDNTNIIMISKLQSHYQKKNQEIWIHDILHL